jgi:hypothetical protein
MSFAARTSVLLPLEAGPGFIWTDKKQITWMTFPFSTDAAESPEDLSALKS